MREVSGVIPRLHFDMNNYKDGLSLTEIAKTAAVSWDRRKLNFMYVSFEMPIKHSSILEMLRATRYSGYKSRLELKNGSPHNEMALMCKTG